MYIVSLSFQKSFDMDILEVLRDIIFYLGLMSPQCFESLVVDLNFSDTVCLKFAVSKALGLGIVVGSSLVKLPQVVKIFNSSSAEGISFLGILLELLAISFSGAYSFRNNFPFSAYGESLFLALQTGIIALLVLSFSKGKLSARLFLSIYSGEFGCKYFTLFFYDHQPPLLGTVWALMNPLITPTKLLWYGQASNIPMILLGEIRI